jgi:hypothetical protein
MAFGVGGYVSLLRLVLERSRAGDPRAAQGSVHALPGLVGAYFSSLSALGGGFDT